MAVVSISRIQIRRGKKESASGLPQLASGELGWAVDSQELFIGNGSVGEGAPYVGNSKLLSEHDNLFEFADTYAYKQPSGNFQTGATVNFPVYKTLQERLDDLVNVTAFGATGDGTDQTVEIQRAIDQLYLNPSNKGLPVARVTLAMGPGVYLISAPIYVPSHVTIVGAGSDKTLILSPNNDAFRTINDASTIGSYALDSTTTVINQARRIRLEGMTISCGSFAGLLLQDCKDSTFNDLQIFGVYELGDEDTFTTDAGIVLNSQSTAITSNNNTFNNVYVNNKSYAVYSNDNVNNNTFNYCNFGTLENGVLFGLATIIGNPGQDTGPSSNTFNFCNFSNIVFEGIYVAEGKHNKSNGNTFTLVGNDGLGEENSKHPVIRYTHASNTSTNDHFSRSDLLSSDPAYLVNYQYTSEILGPIITQVGKTHRITMTEYESLSKLIKLPARSASRGYVIEYFYRSSHVNAARNGCIHLVVDPVNDTYSLTDEYDFTGDNALIENLRFSAQQYDENGDTELDTVAIMVLNYTSNDNAEFTYTVKYKT